MCLGYRDAHGYASLLSKWQHRRQSWEKGSLQIPKCWCAMCSRNRKPSADGNRELPNSANKSPVEKAVDRKRRGCSLQTAGAKHPLQWLSPHVWAGRGSHWVEEGSQYKMGGRRQSGGDAGNHYRSTCTRKSSSDRAEDQSSLINSVHFCLIVMNTILIVIHALKSSSLTHYLQIYCTGFTGPRSHTS